MPYEPLPEERKSITHRFAVDSMDGYLVVGLYEDGRPGEIFIYFQEEGTMARGMGQVFAVMTSLALQHGVPLDHIVRRLKGMQFEPRGLTKNPDIPMTTSIADYVARWLEGKFLGEER
jgi:ribonucleoside-diphosphate reductase alpha chain